MSERNYLAEAAAIANRKRLQGIDPQKYALHIWMMFIAADILESSALEIQEILKGSGQFIQEDKQHINAILFHSGKFVRDVDRSCTENFAIKFGDYTEECTTLLRCYMSNQLNKMKDIFAEKKEGR